jgi:GT2 family glycosyltransferase
LNTATSPTARHDLIGTIEGDPGQGWDGRLRSALAASDAPLLLLVAPGVMPDAFTLAQMAGALAESTDLDAVSPVGVRDIATAWALDDHDDAVLEAWTWAPHVALAAAPDVRCALWRREAAERALRASPGTTPAIHGARLPHLAVALGEAEAEHRDGAPFRIDPEWRPSRLALRRPAPTAAGRDGRPVVLHVLHDWGGGVARFVADQMRDDPHADHLALVSSGDERRGYGQRLALHLGLDTCPIRCWPCTPAIGDTGDTHPTVRAALAESIASFGVSALRVSSLIGTTLDVLRTGLPTAFVVHDLFPFWPVLDDLEPLPRWEAARLAEAARQSGFRFHERHPAVWQARAATAVEALRDAGARIIAPSRFAASRLAGVAPTLPAATIIPHGLPPLAMPARAPRRRPGPLRVLVPGRLKGGKGEWLLDALLPQSPAGLQWCFAGGGARAEHYAQSMGGQAMGDYRRDDLPGLVASFDPDLALLPSLLPETYGYVLSEMQALGLPVLAAACGAYAERAGLPDSTVTTVAPTAPAFAAALDTAAAAPERLPRPAPSNRGMDDARRAWAAVQPAGCGHSRLVGDACVVVLQHAQGMLLASVEALTQERDDAYRAHDRDTGDLTHQRDAAMSRAEELMRDLTREREQVAAHIAVLASDVEHHRTALRLLKAEQQAIEREIAAMREAAAELAGQRDEAYRYYERDTADLIRQRDVALSQRDAAQDQLARAQRILAHPMVRWPLRLRERFGDGVAALQYRARRGADLVLRGLRSLRSRGVAATWAAVRRRFSVTAGAPAAHTDNPTTAPLAFALPASVRASIVIPVHGKLDYTLACLRSLAQTQLPSDVEVIVIDDASPDETGTVLPSIPGLHYHRNASNLGFVGSCNAGAAMARGEFLVFLNNDTTLTPGWLDTLLQTFETHPDTGLAGAQLVYPDGRLQESGGIVFSDGSGWNFGRFEDPKHPAYTFVREADYCSGAAIALPRALFERLGGFDERYAPAYYEDTDLAMKVRDAGLKVRVQPASVVIHHEGITAGTDTGSGVKAYQVRNQQRFLERWHDVLARRHPAPTQAAHYAAQHRARARVLVIDATTPMPDRDSGSVRLFELLRLLVDEGCGVTFFPENGLDDGRYTQALRDLGVEAWTQPWLGALPDWLAKHGARFQLIIVSRHYILSPLLPLLRRHAPQARIVFDTVDLHHLREQREADERDDAALRRAAARTRADELALIGSVDRTWVVSPVEKALLAESVPGAVVDVVSNIHRVRGAGPAMATRHGLLFVGGFRHPPNVDAALWLADEILPRIQEHRPDITLSLVGSEAPPAILDLGERPGITVHGHVPDLEPLIDAHRFSIAPLRYGAGVKGKINQALAHGLPVVATRCAVEGMGLTHGIDALVADDAEGLAKAVLAAYDDEPLWQQLVQGGLANTEREFSPERARATLRAIFNQLR